MRIGGKLGIGVVAVGLVLSTAQAANAAPTEEKTKRPGIDTVTLITGDRVTMVDGKISTVRPGEGREGVTFSRLVADGHSYVFPSDARRLVSTGQLDIRLFDLTTLVEFGYDDAHRATVPLIVTHPAGHAAPRVAGASRELPSINGVAIEAGKDTTAWDALTDGGAVRTAAAGVTTVWLDGKRKSTLDKSAVQIGAPAAWEAGFTGEGVKVAVLDTGVDQTHPDLADREVAEQNFSDAPDNTDNFGHGTHVASIAAGTGAKSGGKYRGIAHGASILDGKVLNDGGFGQESWIVAGMEWAAKEGADIANLSLGGLDTTAVDPLEQAVESLSAQYGTLFVIAAGNSGADYTVGSPASAPSSLAVGAVDRDDSLASFSSRGPTQVTDAIKPDVTAPGVGIVAALHSAGTISPPVEEGYTALSGTSMATPHVAGAAALVAQQHPDWTGQQIKSALSGSAEPTDGLTAFEQGAGRIDVARAINQTVVSEPANLNLGIVAWPHDDDQPVTAPLTYRNLGTSDVTLDLTVDNPVFSLSTNQITVPAGGTAAVDVTGDVGRTTVDGGHTAAVVATAGDSVTRTPVSITREVESYDVTLNYTDENGAPTSEYSSFLIGLDNGRLIAPYDADGSETVRVPKGRYVADHTVFTEQGAHINSIAQPGLVLEQDTTVDVAATMAKPIDITPPAAATPDLADIGYQMETDQGIFIGGPIALDPSTVSTAQIGDPLPGSTMLAWVNTMWTGADGSNYGLAWFLDEFPTGYTRAVSRRELATVRQEFGTGAAGDQGLAGSAPQPRSGSAFVVGVLYPVPLPGVRTAYVTTENTRWRTSFLQVTSANELAAILESPVRSYRAGRTFHEPYNHPVFGPGSPPAAPPLTRAGDTITVDVWLFTDGDGNSGLTNFQSASTKLYLDDQLVGETPFDGLGVFPDLPAAAGNYRVTTEAVRVPHIDVSTAVSAEWTFRSSHVDGAEPAALDLNVVRFRPKLDTNNTAPAGRPFLVPLKVLDETGASVRPRRLTVEASYDEGRTWRRVPVTSKMEARLHHPAGATSVSLRASATDRDGNTVKQTIIRAYKLR